MKSPIGNLKIFFIVFLFFIGIHSAYADATQSPAFKLKAKSALLINAVSGQIVFEQDADKRMPPASLTKLMTLCIALDAVDNGYISMSDQVTISKKAWKTGGSRMFVRVDTTVELEKLLKGIAVVSGNDACVAVAEYIAGVEEAFVEKMNNKASVLGMTNTVFKDCNGLNDEEQFTTARDMALLGYNYLKEHPEALQFHSMKKMTFNKITQRNRNGLLWLDYGIDGLKTGHLEKAGYHLIATANRKGDRFLAIVMGGKSETQRENTALELLNYGYSNFTTFEIPEDKTRGRSSVWYGTEGEVILGLPEDLFITIPRDAVKDVFVEKDFPEKIFAPVEKGKELGTLSIIVDDQVLKTFPLVALQEVEKAGFFKGSFHGILLFFILPPYLGALIVLGFLGFYTIGKFVSKKMKKKNNNSISDLDNLFG